MKQDKLQKTSISRLNHNDRFGWEIKIYEDVTDITYTEWDAKGVETKRELFSIPASYDLQVFEEAIKLRKQDVV